MVTRSLMMLGNTKVKDKGKDVDALVVGVGVHDTRKVRRMQRRLGGDMDVRGPKGYKKYKKGRLKGTVVGVNGGVRHCT